MRLTAVALSHSGRMLFAGTMKGTVWSVKFPLTASGDWAEFQAHEASVSKVGIFIYLFFFARDIPSEGLEHLAEFIQALQIVIGNKYDCAQEVAWSSEPVSPSFIAPGSSCITHR